MSNQKPIAENLFTWPSEKPKLLGSKDSETGRYFFPAKRSNTHEQVELSTKGTLWTWTVQRFMPKTPYIGTDNPEYIVHQIHLLHTVEGAFCAWIGPLQAFVGLHLGAPLPRTERY